MFKLACLICVLALSAYAVESEADLQQPVSDVSTMTRQEQQETPSIDEVKMKNVPEKVDTKKLLQERVNHSKPWTSY